jgi:hypothetical protein
LKLLASRRRERPIQVFEAAPRRALGDQLGHRLATHPFDRGERIADAGAPVFGSGSTANVGLRPSNGRSEYQRRHAICLSRSRELRNFVEDLVPERMPPQEVRNGCGPQRETFDPAPITVRARRDLRRAVVPGPRARGDHRLRRSRILSVRCGNLGYHLPPYPGHRACDPLRPPE